MRQKKWTTTRKRKSKTNNNYCNVSLVVAFGREGWTKTNIRKERTYRETISTRENFPGTINACHNNFVLPNEACLRRTWHTSKNHLRYFHFWFDWTGQVIYLFYKEFFFL